MATFLRRLRARIKYWNNADELKKELDAHRELAAASFAASGDSERESRWKAARLLGNTTMAREDARAVWMSRWLEQLLQDTRYALRSMRREWGFAITASITLALGLGVLVAVFTVFNAIFFKPWPVRDAGRVFGISETLADPKAAEGLGGPAMRISFVAWDQIRTSLASADLAVKYDYQDTLRPAATGPGRSGRFGLVDADFIGTIGVGLQLGTLPSDSAVPAIAISDAVWRSSFGADPSVIGRSIWMGTHPTVVTGVLEPRFLGLSARVYDGLLVLNRETTGWLTRGLTVAPDLLTNPKGCCVEILGRLRPGYSREQAGREIEARANAVQKDLGLPSLHVILWDTTPAGRPGGVRNEVPALFRLLFAGCGIVTLLACANIGNLQLARGLRRSREVGVRLSLGASRRRLMRQFLTESAVLAVFGTAGGLLIAWMLPPVVMAFDSSSAVAYKPDANVVLFAVAAAIIATLLSGLAPAARVTRINWRGGATNVVASAGRLRGVLLATQIALSLALIAGAALLSRGALRAAGGADAGFEFRDINDVVLAVTKSDDSIEEKDIHAAVKRAVAALPGLAIVDTAPWSGRSESARLSVPGRVDSIGAAVAGLNQHAITLLNIQLLAGRWYSDDKLLYEAAVTRSLARALWNDEDAVGRTFLKAGEPHPYSVVGVVDDLRLVDTTARPTALLAPRTTYLPEILARPGSETQVKAVVSAIDPSIRVISRPLIDGLQKQMKNSFIGISIASGLGLVALLLASLGVFGVFAYIVEERRREIGVRLALGASRSQVRRNIIAATRWPVALGLAAGLALAIAGGFVLRSNLYGLSILDPLSYLAVAGVLAAAAMIATYIPMQRATRVDPAVTLRAD